MTTAGAPWPASNGYLTVALVGVATALPFAVLAGVLLPRRPR